MDLRENVLATAEMTLLPLKSGLINFPPLKIELLQEGVSPLNHVRLNMGLAWGGKRSIDAIPEVRGMPVWKESIAVVRRYYNAWGCVLRRWFFRFRKTCRISDLIVAPSRWIFALLHIRRGHMTPDDLENAIIMEF
jgi:hypothetical protein